MKQGFRQSMAWLHTWAALPVGWVLYFMFVTGTLGYVYAEIDQWMQPERPLHQEILSTEAYLELGLQQLEQQAAGAQRWIVYPPSGHPEYGLRVAWSGLNGNGLLTDQLLDSNTGLPVETRATGGGELLYQMHYLLHYLPNLTAYWIVGFCTMAMLLALLTGIVIHKRIFKDFFTFRPAKGQRSWLDGHNVMSVIALPFFLIITYSGLLFFNVTYMPGVVAAIYGAEGAGQQDYFSEAYPNFELPQRSGVATAGVAPGRVLAAVSELSSAQLLSYMIWNPGDEQARVIVATRRSDPRSGAEQYMFNGVSGDLLQARGPDVVGARGVNDLFIGLHEGLFAPPLLRWLYVISGFLGCLMIATGLVLWIVKRRDRKGEPKHLGVRAVEKVNVAVIAGLPIAIAAYFWANRLLPVELANRVEWEANVMFGVWLLTLCHALLKPARKAWQELCYVAAGAYLLLPVLNAATTERHLGVTLPWNGNPGSWILAGFDLLALLLGLTLLYVALRLKRSARVEAGDEQLAGQQPALNPEGA